LHCLPLFNSEDALLREVRPGHRNLLTAMPVFTHVLTHKDLHLHPWRLLLPARADKAERWGDGQWVNADAWPTLGLPAPVRKLLQRDSIP